jgi:hypothetical protein
MMTEKYGHFDTLKHVGLNAGNALCVVLVCLHVHWFILIARIGYKLITTEQHNDIGKQEYEGNSASDSNSGDDGDDASGENTDGSDVDDNSDVDTQTATKGRFRGNVRKVPLATSAGVGSVERRPKVSSKKL